jgi:hypothetical protein
MKVVDRVEAHYDVQAVEFGRVYKWRPESVLIECECGERLSLSTSVTSCGACGADHTVVVQEELTDRLQKDEVLHPWRYTRDRQEDGGLPV